MARRPGGGTESAEMSRSPDRDMCRVRGMGVAVRVSRSTSARSCLKCSLWVTPKRCSSSMITRPSRWKRTSLERIRCVPTTMSTSPEARASRIPLASLVVV